MTLINTCKQMCFVDLVPCIESPGNLNRFWSKVSVGFLVDLISKLKGILLLKNGESTIGKLKSTYLLWIV